MMIAPFKLERYFAQYEFNARYLLSASDCESLAMSDLLGMSSQECLTMWHELKLGYTESQGHPALRVEAAALYDEVPEENILIAAPEELIFITMQTLLAPGEHVVVVNPAYQSLYEVARAKKCSITAWDIKPVEGGWKLDLDELERSINSKTRMLVINFPHNPTGHLPSTLELQAIVDMARQHDLIVFSDEMYRWLEYEPHLRLPAVCDLYEKGISLSGLSKSFALPGLRIGWLATQERSWIDRWQSFKDYTTICNSAPGEVLGLIALQKKEEILQRNLEIIKENITTADKFFESHAECFIWRKPHAGSVAFPEWIGPATVECFCQQALDATGVMIVPGTLFEYPGNYFRLGLGRRNFPEAIAKVEEFLVE